LGNTAPAEPVPRKIGTVHDTAQISAAQKVESNTSKTKTAIPQPNQVNVSVDDKQNVIYRFTDPSNGEVVRQVPPEEILRIMRNIEDLLHESEQKLKVTL
jgi:uncharacterized FlaG/YvyC family protein